MADKIVGRVFNIQRFSVHDGPGIRTTVFLKGCNLRCAWCHNPESYKRELQIGYQPDKCTGCGTCSRVCPNGVYIRDRQRMNGSACTACGNCVRECLYGALQIWGADKSVQEVMAIVEKDIDYFRNSNGGLTLSGGEPLLQPDFAGALFKRAKESGIHTALDTAADVPYGSFQKVLPYTDLILLDLKIMDSGLHQRYTGRPNGQILDNARRLCEGGIKIQIRVPLIKSINDSIENAQMLREFIAEYPNIEGVKLLPYHSMGRTKADGIGVEMQTFEPPAENVLGEIRKNLEPFVISY